MRRDVLLLEEMIHAAVQAAALVEGVAVEDLAADRIRRDALLWNFTVLGEAAAQLSDELKQDFAASPGASRPVCATGSCMATGPSTWTSSIRRRRSGCQASPMNWRVLAAVAAKDEDGPS